ncbi:hypothetical protein [Pseudoroseomonas cervicalis]|uniref:hypothetical protein n=1 Tax=Teichococcus cervicalis TaxID=204525 RepID=UPI0022F17AD5|nr:hypothetical protein [Pseudoroseomonas cervicalis]WBV43502.1 hypothetical protein PFY06_02730 [Pseudoroseomonas cervicalis]
MLAQRRSRLARQIVLLDRQREAAGTGFDQLSRRMAQLATRLFLPAEAAAPLRPRHRPPCRARPSGRGRPHPRTARRHRRPAAPGRGARRHDA